MDWKQKFQAISVLDWEASLKMTEAGNWYVSAHIEIKDGAVLRGGGNHAATCEDAVEAWWDEFVTDLKPECYLVTRAMSPERAAYRWKGFMWASVTENLKVSA